MSSGLEKNSAATVLSISMLITSIVLPISGKLIDRGFGRSILSFGILALILGLLGIGGHADAASYPLLQSPWISVIFISFFIFGTSIIYSAAKRICEGLSAKEKLSQSISWVYLIENSGIGLAMVISYFFIARYKQELLLLDALTTVALGIVVLRLTMKEQKVEIKGAGSSVAQSSDWATVLRALRMNQFQFLAYLFAYCLIFLHLSVVQVFFFSQFEEAHQSISLMFGVNTAVVVLWTVLVGRRMNFAKIQESCIFAIFTGALILVSFGYVVVVASQAIPFILLGHIVWSVGEAILLPLISFQIISRFQEFGCGVSVGIRDGLIRLSLVLAPMFAILSDYSHFSQMLFLITALTLLTFGFMFFDRNSKSSIPSG